MKPDRVISLEAIYNGEEGPVFMTGIQALVRLPLMQRRFDRQRGLNTGGLISGYRGSPIGAYDQQLWKAQAYLDAHDVVFQPGLNEDLAATALWGAQMHEAFGPSKVDGVFGIWYGKGPGVDRSMDVLKHANSAGSSRHGGVLALAGDDHGCQSSTLAHQSEQVFAAALMPTVPPPRTAYTSAGGWVEITGTAAAAGRGEASTAVAVASATSTVTTRPRADARRQIIVPPTTTLPPSCPLGP